MFLELKHEVQTLGVYTLTSETLSVDNVLNFCTSLRKDPRKRIWSVTSLITKAESRILIDHLPIMPRNSYGNRKFKTLMGLKQ